MRSRIEENDVDHPPDGSLTSFSCTELEQQRSCMVESHHLEWLQSFDDRLELSQEYGAFRVDTIATFGERRPFALSRQSLLIDDLEHRESS